jgi:Zn-dependent protease with chaperone function
MAMWAILTTSSNRQRNFSSRTNKINYKISLPSSYYNNRREIGDIHPITCLVTSVFLVALSLSVSYKRILDMREGGGTYVPSLLKAVPLGDGGVFTTPGGQNQEKVLQNIIGELAVAAGAQEPDVYILPNEETINAMAAGLESDDSSIILTKGALKYLNRDELAALLAHEFGHLVNRDTSHFTLMSGWLHGLFFLKTCGYRLFVHFPNNLTFLTGLAISSLGLFGNLIGRILQSAFSRSREHLADSAAVQFTRDPLALASVLKKIGGQDQPKRTSILNHPEFRHLYISQPRPFWEKIKFLKTIFSTHPPIEERIWELDPKWDGWYWDFDKNPVDYITDLRPKPREAAPQMFKHKSVILP